MFWVETSQIWHHILSPLPWKMRSPCRLPARYTFSHKNTQQGTCDYSGQLFVDYDHVVPRFCVCSVGQEAWTRLDQKEDSKKIMGECMYLSCLVSSTGDANATVSILFRSKGRASSVYCVGGCSVISSCLTSSDLSFPCVNSGTKGLKEGYNWSHIRRPSSAVFWPCFWSDRGADNRKLYSRWRDLVDKWKPNANIQCCSLMHF